MLVDEIVDRLSNHTTDLQDLEGIINNVHIPYRQRRNAVWRYLQELELQAQDNNQSTSI